MARRPDVLVVVVLGVSVVVVSSVVVSVVVVVVSVVLVFVVVVLVFVVVVVVGVVVVVVDSVGKGVSGRVEWFAVCTTAIKIAMITRTPRNPAAVTAAEV